LTTIQPTCVKEGQTKEQHLFGEEQLSCGLQCVYGLSTARVLLFQLVVVLGIIGHESQCGQKHDAQHSNYREHADDQIPCLLVDAGLVLELIVHEQIPNEHAALQQGPEDARVTGNRGRFTAARQIRSLSRPSDRGTQSQHCAAHVQQYRRREHERDHEGSAKEFQMF